MGKTAVSLFTGCGGSDAGLLSCGFDILMANDKFEYARDFYMKNFNETDYKLCDIREIESFPKADLLVGCYPCQGFSQGGARDPKRNINYLYREFDRALRQIKPKAFIVENVSGMNRSNFSHLLNNQIIRFKLAGYIVSWKILDARDYGVAQERKRIFIVGINSNIGERYEFPKPTHSSESKLSYLTIGQALYGMPKWPEGEYCTHEFHWYYLSRNRRRDWNEQSKTIVSNMRHIPLHPISPKLIKVEDDKWEFETKKKARRFSYREAAVLQGFNKSCYFPRVKTTSLEMKYKIIGNAVPPPLFKAVTSAIPDIW